MVNMSSNGLVGKCDYVQMLARDSAVKYVTLIIMPDTIGLQRGLAALDAPGMQLAWYPLSSACSDLIHSRLSKKHMLALVRIATHQLHAEVFAFNLSAEYMLRVTHTNIHARTV